MTYRLGVDIGGTFTDFALFDEGGSRIAVHKRLTTPDDPSAAVLGGATALLERENVAMAAVESIAHGTTLVTNSIIERRGARAGMLVTAGFRDILDMGFEQRYDLFDLRLRWPDPLVPRRLRREVRERIAHDGRVTEPLDRDGVHEAVHGLVNEDGIDALAICFLHAYANPIHEEAAGEVVREAFPDLYVSRSAGVFGNMREYERWTTATMNAYAQPMFDRYVERLERGLAESGFAGQLHIMTSSGASIVPETARRFPVRALESGPAAGALMSAHHGRSLALPDLLSFDMGGTTAKGALIRRFAPLKQYDLEVGRVHEFKRGSGLPAKLPVIDMIEIGSGGGSLARVDERGLIRVGPRSAGADPGPACYGKGGTGATLTDANVVLGYLDPGFFLGGEMRLDPIAAREAIERHVAGPAGLEPIRAAWGVHEIANEDVARAFRIHASERGFDYRDSSMVAFGGSGPVHALAIARKLRIPRVVFPIGAGVMSALGLLVSPLGFEVSRSRRAFVADLDAAQFEAIIAPLVDEATGFLRRAGVAEPAVVCRLDMRYQGQGYEIEVTVPGDGTRGGYAAAFSRLETLFRAQYAEIFAETFLDEPLEIVSWKVEAAGSEAPLAYHGMRGGERGRAKRSRALWFGDAFVDCEVIDRYGLAVGTTVEGPAVVEERESTCVLAPGDRATVDERLNLVAELANRGGDA
ncbi:MAG: hydantoinase/oxoprolinase family protein [Immundisolibacterales bacterium]|nr:hydantoinase/oxoprolinase family protein [Immundisolibacterales bacterium]